MHFSVRFTVLMWVLAGTLSAQSWTGEQIPLHQSTLRARSPEAEAVSEREAAANDRWLGLGVRDIRWAPDGSGVYFRWNLEPYHDDDPTADPWFWASRDGRSVREVPPAAQQEVPSPDIAWSQDGQVAAWASGNALFRFSSTDGVHRVFASEDPIRSVAIHRGGAIHFVIGESLFAYEWSDKRLQQITRKQIPEKEKSKTQRFLEQQQRDLLEVRRDEWTRNEDAGQRKRLEARAWTPQAIPAAGGTIVDPVLSPDGSLVVFRLSESPTEPTRTQYMDFASSSGYAEPHAARPKVGEEQTRWKMGIVLMDPSRDPKETDVRWVRFAPDPDLPVIVYGPYWNPAGSSALVQVVATNHKDRWICKLNLSTGEATPLVHDRDDAWLGGPPPLAGYLQPALLEWIDDQRFVFASERTGWSHLYLHTPGREVEALTSGEWEVRGAELSQDKRSWLIRASREDPCTDHLYRFAAGGGDLERLTSGAGRHEGWLSPDGRNLARVFSETVQLPDLFVEDLEGIRPKRITISGTDNFYRFNLRRPEVVSFPHPDGRPVWGALFKPDKPHPSRPAILHIHGGGYRQFSHRGYSVYGWGSHLGLIHYLVEQGYTVLDFDYRGGAGFGRDYRTDIYRSMGVKDVDGAVAAIDFLVAEHGVARDRVGVYGLSYGGFFTLMSLFKHPGVFAAGIANAAVSDWAHYNHVWTSRVLNLPYDDNEAYELSSPIYHSSGLEDPLLIVHGLIDDNVQFQDAARVVQKLIEEEKQFEVMYYPVERHVIATEPSRLDYVRRVTRFFDQHLRRE